MSERGGVHTFHGRWTRAGKDGRRRLKRAKTWSWRFTYRKQRYCGGRGYQSRAEAREAGEIRRREVVAGQVQDPRKTTYETLEQIVLAEYSLKPDVEYRRVQCYLRWLRTFFGGRLAADIQRADLIAYVNARRSTPTRGRPGAADGTIKLELSILRRGMRLAQESGRLLNVPRFPTIQTYPRKGFLTPDQLSAILPELPEWWRAAYEVGWITGWRFRSEVLSRTWPDVDWQADVLRLNAGEGKRRRARIYPLTDRLKDILVFQAVHVEKLEHRLSRVIPWVFPGPTGDRQCNPYSTWHSACRRAGVQGKLPHDLRRTFVRDLNLARVPAPAGMAASGHTDERTYRGYLGNDEELIRWAVEQVEEQRAKPGKVVGIRRAAPARLPQPARAVVPGSEPTES